MPVSLVTGGVATIVGGINGALPPSDHDGQVISLDESRWVGWVGDVSSGKADVPKGECVEYIRGRLREWRKSNKGDASARMDDAVFELCRATIEYAGLKTAKEGVRR